MIKNSPVAIVSFLVQYHFLELEEAVDCGTI